MRYVNIKERSIGKFAKKGIRSNTFLIGKINGSVAIYKNRYKRELSSNGSQERIALANINNWSVESNISTKEIKNPRINLIDKIIP